MRRYRVRRAADIARDLGLIEEHLVQVCHEFGDYLESAMDRAAARIHDALTTMRTFATHPHRGTEHPNIRPGIRTVTSKSFIFTFEVDESSSEVRILAIFSAVRTNGVRYLIASGPESVSGLPADKGKPSDQAPKGGFGAFAAGWDRGSGDGRRRLPSHPAA